MVTTWTDTPLDDAIPTKAQHINELRAAMDAAGGTPPAGWSDGPRLDGSVEVGAVHVVELRNAMQGLWNTRFLGLIPNWTTGVEPGGQTLGTPPTPTEDSNVTDLRRWFNWYETWGDLRGVHWFNAGRTDLPRMGWNVETVIGVSNEDNTYNSGAVATARQNCINARNYGLVNIVRLDWKPGVAVPADQAQYGGWIEKFNLAVNRLLEVATVFIVGNEPTIEGAISSGAYANAYNALRAQRVAGTLYLVTGPAVWSRIGEPVNETDLVWLDRVAGAVTAPDGFALHTYHSMEDVCSRDPRLNCLDPNDPNIAGDRGFKRYRNFIDQIRGGAGDRWADRPVYITEFNTHGLGATSNADRTPQDNYPLPGEFPDPNSTFMAAAYEDIYNYNVAHSADRAHYPVVLTACWFVDEARSSTQSEPWDRYALSNTAQPRLAQARGDFIVASTATGLGA